MGKSFAVRALMLGAAGAFAQPGPLPGTDSSRRQLPGPWDNDVRVFRAERGGRIVQLAAFERAGVPTAARLADGRLLAAFQHFPQDDDRNFDRVAVSFSEDEGAAWSKPAPIAVEGLQPGLARPFDPTLVPLPDRRVRLYFTSNRNPDFRRSTPAIYSAVSADGIHYRFEPGVRFAVDGRIVIDCAAALHDGVYHLIVPDNGRADEFMAPGGPGPGKGPRRPAGDPPWSQPPGGTGYHATSRDGLTFERVADVKLPSGNNRWLGSLVSDGGQLLFFGTGPGPWPAWSPDGREWQAHPNAARIPGADPGVLKLRDGSWLLLATSPPRPGTASARQRGALPQPPADSPQGTAEDRQADGRWMRLPYPIVHTGQVRCYDNRGEIPPPKPGQPFYGQDAQFRGRRASYTPAAAGLTVRDHVTGLIWQASPDTDGDGQLTSRDKLTCTEAQALPAKLNTAKFAGFDDWRLPSIKELYSLFDGRGTDPSGPMERPAPRPVPYLDTNFFAFAYGDVTGERLIDAQYVSSTYYVSRGPPGPGKVFGVNFADGRIKGYDLQLPGGGRQKRFYAICVRGNPAYGKNDFQDNGDGTVTDRATGLMWSKADSGRGMNWQEALAWVQAQNARRFLGHNDWRLPGVKELQSIVDYTRSPDATQSPAIAPVFNCTAITNEAHELDYPYYWSATTHAQPWAGAVAMYVAFGRASGWMRPRGMGGGPPNQPDGFGPGPDSGPGRPPGREPAENVRGDYRLLDVHGAGSQRSDPKAGNPADFPHGRGPQGDVIRIFNFVRPVRGGAEHN